MARDFALKTNCKPCEFYHSYVHRENFARFAIDKLIDSMYALRSMNDEIQALGWQLMECSRETEEFSAQRGLINELFPFIYEASKRMSSRAISRWLAAKNVKLSAVTIAKALRNPEPYWQELLEEIEAPCRIVAKAFGYEVDDLMGSRELFERCAKESPMVEAVTREGTMSSLDEIRVAANELEEKWFSLPESIRETCLSYADQDPKEVEVPEVNASEGQPAKDKSL